MYQGAHPSIINLPKCHLGRFPSASLRYGIFLEGVVGLESEKKVGK